MTRTVLAQVLQDTSVSVRVKSLQKEWEDLSDSIHSVKEQVDNEMSKLRKTLGIMLGCTLVFAAVMGVVAMVASGEVPSAHNGCCPLA
jgi:hypothetical protein